MFRKTPTSKCHLLVLHAFHSSIADRNQCFLMEVRLMTMIECMVQRMQSQSPQQARKLVTISIAVVPNM